MNLCRNLIYTILKEERSSLPGPAASSAVRWPGISSRTTPESTLCRGAFIQTEMTECTDATRIDLGSGRMATVREVVENLHRIVGSVEGPRFGAIEDRPMEQIRTAQVVAQDHAEGWAETDGGRVRERAQSRPDPWITFGGASSLRIGRDLKT